MKSLLALALLTALSATAWVRLDDLAGGSGNGGGVATAKGPMWLIGRWLTPTTSAWI